jgi:hypothetical protein
MLEPWIGSFAGIIVAPICGGFACATFTRRSSTPLRRSAKREIRVLKVCLGRNGLDATSAAVRVDSEHAH